MRSGRSPHQKKDAERTIYASGFRPFDRPVSLRTSGKGEITVQILPCVCGGPIPGKCNFLRDRQIPELLSETPLPRPNRVGFNAIGFGYFFESRVFLGSFRATIFDATNGSQLILQLSPANLSVIRSRADKRQLFAKLEPFQSFNERRS